MWAVLQPWRDRLLRRCPWAVVAKRSPPAISNAVDTKSSPAAIRLSPGELDLVANDRGTIVFVEVKTRQSHNVGHPAEAVDAAKQRRLTRLAVTFLKRHGLLERPARFDVVAITWPANRSASHSRTLLNAFDAVGQWEFHS